jgi:hypothetical protein
MDSSLIHKLVMKNPRTSEEMLAITNKYVMAEEGTLDIREQKKDNELGHSDQPSTSKSHDKKRKVDLFVANVERSRRNKEYRPRPNEFEGFLDRIYIFHPQGKHKTRDYNWLKGFTDEVLKKTKKADQENKPEDPKGDFPEAQKRSTTSMVDPTPMSKEEEKTHRPGGHGGLTRHPQVPEVVWGRHHHRP